MSKQSFFTALAAASFLSSASAHMVMKAPQPYLPHTVSTSPLSGNGSLQFPCQMGVGGDYSSSSPTSAKAGGTVPVSFTGSAIHGGGSCQFSLFKLGDDNKVTANPGDWKVIHSVIGGCPGTAVGNLDSAGEDADQRPDGPQCTDSSETECHRTFNIPIDKNVPSGNYAMAWTWFNNIGNREMYMNCAPVKITGGASDDTFLSKLPGIFVANVPGYCSTAEQGVLGIPNPGDSVENLADPNAAVLGTCAAGSGPPAGGNKGTSTAVTKTGVAPTGAHTAPTGAHTAPTGAHTAPTGAHTAPTGPAAPSPTAGTDAPGHKSGNPDVSNTATLTKTQTHTQTQGSHNHSPGAKKGHEDTSPKGDKSTMHPPAITPEPDAPSVTATDNSVSATNIPNKANKAAVAPANPPGGAAPAQGDCEHPCTTDGTIVCIDASSWGMCSHGCAAPQPLAAGTTCTNGKIMKRMVIGGRLEHSTLITKVVTARAAVTGGL